MQPEQGRSFTIGTVFTPTFAPNLSMTLDYYRIILTDAIGQTNLSQALQACYADPNFMTRANNPLDPCFGYNHRNADETLSRINQYSININRLVAKGIGIWIGVQAFVNMGVNLGLLPTKGLTLPLMSYGGSGIVANCIALAVLLRVDWENRALMRGEQI